MSNPLFSVIVCTYQRYALLQKALASLERQTLSKNLFDVWIMDNSPPSEEGNRWASLHADHENWNIITLDTPGLSHARNAGVSVSTGEILVFLDDDAEADPDWLSSYKRVFDQLGSAAMAVGGKIQANFEGERPSWLADPLLTFLSVIDWGHDLIELTDNRTPVGANMAIRRKAFDIAGLFPENLGRKGDEKSNLLSGEEESFFKKLRATNGKLFYTPDAVVSHFIPNTRLTQSWFRRRFVWQGLSNQLVNPLEKEFDLPLWSHIVGYIRSVPPKESFMMGLCWDTQDPVLFCQQLDCLAYMVQLLSARGDLAPEIKERLGCSKAQNTNG